MELHRLRIMERLGLTHKQWYALPQWERDTWLAREVYKQEQASRLIDTLRDRTKNSYNRYGVNAIMMIKHGML